MEAAGGAGQGHSESAGVRPEGREAETCVGVGWGGAGDASASAGADFAYSVPCMGTKTEGSALVAPQAITTFERHLRCRDL